MGTAATARGSRVLEAVPASRKARITGATTAARQRGEGWIMGVAKVPGAFGCGYNGCSWSLHLCVPSQFLDLLFLDVATAREAPGHGCCCSSWSLSSH